LVTYKNLKKNTKSNNKKRNAVGKKCLPRLRNTVFVQTTKKKNVEPKLAFTLVGIQTSIENIVVLLRIIRGDSNV